MFDEARLKARMDAVDSEIGKMDLKIREYIRQVKDMDLEILKALDAGSDQIKLEFLLNKQKNLYNRESKARETKVIYVQQKLELLRQENAAFGVGKEEMKQQVTEVHSMLSGLLSGNTKVNDKSNPMKAVISGMEC